MKVILIRHPEPLVAAGICYGRTDLTVHPSGVEAIRRLATPLLSGVTHVWTSPARRCLEPANSLAMLLNTQVSIDIRLQELDFGEWEGRPWAEVATGDLDLWAASPLTFAPPGGESGGALLERISDFHASLCLDLRGCVIVSHGGPLKVLNALLARRPVDLLEAAKPLGSVTVVTWLP
jgi:alpha-ribazole phosphatase